MATTSFRRPSSMGQTTIPASIAGKPVQPAAAKPAPRAAAAPVPTNRPKLFAPVKGGGDFTPFPEGVYVAVVVGIFDVGTHHSDKFGNDQRKLVLTFETPTERMEIERDGEKLDLPRRISKRYTLSMNEKSNLRREINAIEGHALTDAEAEVYDVFTLAGRACQIQVTQTERDGKVYGNVGAVMALPKGTPTPAIDEEPILFTVEGCDGQTFPENMPGWIVELAQQSAELQG